MKLREDLSNFHEATLNEDGGHPLQSTDFREDIPKLDMKSVIPEKGFICDYMATYPELTESPDEFHLATAFTTIAGVVAGNVYYPSTNPLYTNLYTIVVGPSGIVRKTTALNIGRRYYSKIMSMVNPNVVTLPGRGKKLELLGSMFSPEALADELEHANCTGYVSEYRTLTGNGSKNYQANVVPVLTDLYDCPESYKISFKANKRGKESGCSKIVDRPVINLIGATSPEYFTMSADDAAGGFMGRHLVVYSPGSGRVIPFPLAAETAIVSKLEQQLLKISHCKGQLNMSPTARDLYDAAYRREHQEYVVSKNKSNALGSFQSRKGTFWLKVAAILQISEDTSLTVSAANMGRAISIVSYCGSCYQWLLSQIATDDWQRTRRDILAYIRQNSGCTKTEICRAFQVKSTIRDGVLDALMEAELVTARSEQRGERGAPAVVFYPQRKCS